MMSGPSSTEFLDYDETSLEIQLSQRLSIQPTAPEKANLPAAEFQAAVPHLGIGDDLGELGRRLYRRISRELHAVVCGGDPEDQTDRDKIRKAAGLTDDALVVVLAGVLASSFGLLPAIAGIVAALLLKRIFRPGVDELCEFWSEKLA